MCPVPRSANFFDDAGCTQNGGIGVDIRNPGCLSEAGRGSVFIPNTGLGTTDETLRVYFARDLRAERSPIHVTLRIARKFFDLCCAVIAL